ncbi:MAG TPA: prephenate dehydrogenase [Cyclobacteriaceae bacterium]
MIVSIVGLGLIGGSMAISLKKNGFASRIFGVDNNSNHCGQAVKLGLVEETLPLQTAVKRADLIILSTPVDVTGEVLNSILDNIEDGEKVVTDVGSTKSNICNSVRKHPRRKQYVAGHPIAGTENSGPKAALDYLFSGKTSIICERSRSGNQAIQVVEAMYNALGMHVINMEAEDHDIHLAYISHLSHLTSFSLALAVLTAEKDEKRIFQFSGSGFDSTARLAKSAPSMWVPIFLENKKPLLKVLDEYMHQLQVFKEHIEKEDNASLKQQMEHANDIRRILEGNFILTN